MKNYRCDAIEIRIIVTEVDDAGRPVGELVGAPSKVFRGKVPDVWAECDKAAAAWAKQKAEQAERG